MTVWRKSIPGLAFSATVLLSQDAAFAGALGMEGDESALHAAMHTSSPFFWIAVLGLLTVVSGSLAAIAFLRVRRATEDIDQSHANDTPRLSQVLAPPEPATKEAHGTATEQWVKEEIKRTINERIQRIQDKEETERSALQTNLTSIDTRGLRTEDSVSRLQERIEKLNEQLDACFELTATSTQGYASVDGLQELRKQMEEALDKMGIWLEQQLEFHTLDTQFDKWKNKWISSLASAQTATSRSESLASEEDCERLSSTRETIASIDDRVERFISAIGLCFGNLQSLETRKEWEVPMRQFREFYNRLLGLSETVRSLMNLANIDQMKPPPLTELSFQDVVTGESAEFFRDGYARRMTQALAELTLGAEQSGRDWHAMRTDLVALLDVMYPATPFRGFSAGEDAVAAFVQALEAVRIQEIPLREGKTQYDPTLHEPVPGGRQSQPNVPENTVLKLLRRGYYMDSKVHRRALVSLSS